MGIDPLTQRDRMAEALDAILRLFRGETVTEKTDWYTMAGCRLHLLPYTKPHPEVAVVSAITPSGGRLAGKYDLGMICVAATNPFGFDALGSNWQIACDIAAEHGRTMDPSRLRLVGPMHLAETREQAFANARFGFERYLGYLNNNQPRFIVPAGQDPLEWFIREPLWRVRHPRRRDIADRAALSKAGGFRRVSAAGAQLGRFRRDQALVRALCALCDAAFQPAQRRAAPPPTNGAATTATSSAPSARPRRAPCSTSTRPSRKPPVRRATAPLRAAPRAVAKPGERLRRGWKLWMHTLPSLISGTRQAARAFRSALL